MPEYTRTTWQEGERITSKRLNNLDARIAAALSLRTKVLAALFQNNTVIDFSTDAFEKVLYYDASAGTYSDWTDEARFSQTPYFPDVSVSSLDYVYVGFDDQFSGGTFTLGSPAAATINPGYQYYNGSAWTTVVSLSDATSGLTADGTASWSVSSMTDWDKDDLNTILATSGVDSVDRYWVRINPASGEDFGIHKLVQNTTVSNELEVKAASPAAMSVVVEPGYAFINNKTVALTSQATVSITAPASNSRITIIQLSDAEVLSAKNGDSAASPVAPKVDDNHIKLADVLVAATDTTIADSAITDQRVFTSLDTTISTDKTISIGAGAKYVFDLTGADSYVVIRDPTDTLQTHWFAQDGHGELFPADSALSAGDWAYFDTVTSQLEKADADVRSLAAEGVVIAKPTSTTAILADGGVSKVHSGLTAGADYFLSTTAGGMTTAAPSGSGDIVQRIGRALSTTEFKINVQSNPVELA